MSAICWTRIGLAQGPSVAVLAVALFSAGIGLADRFPPDPVEELRQALKAASPAPSLQQRVVALRNLSDMRRALALREWSPNVADPDEGRSKAKAQALLVDRFKQDVRQALKQGTTNTRLAVLDMLAEMGPSITTPEDTKGIARVFAPEVAELIKSPDTPPSVKEAAARALGQIFADPGIAVPALQELLASPRLGERRAAVNGLLGLIRTVAEVASKAGTASGPQANPGDIIEAVRDVVPLAGRGLSNANLAVRRASAEAMLQAASALLSQAPQPSTGEVRAPTDITTLLKTREALLPAMEVFRQQTPALGKALNDPDLEVRLQTLRAVEDLAATRLRLLPSADVNATPAETPPPGGRRGAARDRGQPTLIAWKFQAAAVSDPLLEALQELLPVLEQQVRDPNVQIRLGAIDVLEELWLAALPAAPVLVRALADPDRFVRWAAARTLGKIGPVEPVTAVPALAGLLFDSDLDVRLSAATALERFGPPAAFAVPDLIRALRASDAVQREAAIRTLEGIGTGAEPAVPALSAALSDPEYRVRQMAAEALGKFGSLAASAEPALRRALDDPNSDVRRAASDALLSIVQAQK
jgi:HEAT repeat protein